MGRLGLGSGRAAKNDEDGLTGTFGKCGLQTSQRDPVANELAVMGVSDQLLRCHGAVGSPAQSVDVHILRRVSANRMRWVRGEPSEAPVAR